MKFSVSVSSFFLATLATVALVSTEATSLRGSALLHEALLNSPLLGRRLEQDANANDDGEAQADDQSNADDAYGDDYTFYDDIALQNCEEGDETCEKAAKYTAYDDEYLASCEEEDEECNDAAAYIAAKQKKEDEANKGIWNVQTVTDKYNSMSRTSKTWAIVLSVWFAILFLTTAYFCCCRKTQRTSCRKSGRKSLRQSLMGRRGGSSSDGDEGEDQKRRSKFRIFRKGNKNKKTNGEY